MTTFAYKDGVLAADTQVTSGMVKIGRITKVAERNGVRWAYSGNFGECMVFDTWMKTGMEGDLPESEDSNFFIYYKDFIMVYEQGYWFRMDNLPHAGGSGREFALGAMAAGASAEEAVRIACQYDTGSSEPVRVV